MKKAKIVILFLIAFAFLTAGCGVKIIPKTEQEGIIDAKHNIITKEKERPEDNCKVNGLAL